MKINNKKLREILLKGNYITDSDLKKSEEYATFHDSSIADYLYSEGLINKDILGQAIGEYYGIPYVDMNFHQPARELVMMIPEEISKKNRIVPVQIQEEKGRIIIATDDPEKKSLEGIIAGIIPGKKIQLAYAFTEDIDQILARYYKTLETRFAKIIESQGRIAPDIIDEIILDAIALNVSDVHMEPEDKNIKVRFRIDGVLQEAGYIPKEYYENILTRIKVLAHLRTDEHMTAQDGSIRFAKDGKVSDLRISIIPTLDGEKIVMRILAEYSRNFALNNLGLANESQATVVSASKKPFGMILTVGPTGAGKTTTLYGIIKYLNRPEVNIATIEDPVEYKIPGINHIQVNSQAKLTFASGLRSIFRQDPDIILVGEIRDRETAELAVNAALTGHLLLSSLHANDASTAIPRLMDMGVEPFLISSTLELIIAQRLVRRICEKCRLSYKISTKDLENKFPFMRIYFPEKTITLYRGKGCETCSNTGYKGRTAIFELIRSTPKLQELILKNPSARQIAELAREQGTKFLFEDGIEKVKSGETSLEELARVANLPGY